MSIHFGSATTFIVHHAMDASSDGLIWPKPTCRDASTPSRSINTFVSDWTKVTCQDCIEWRHA